MPRKKLLASQFGLGLGLGVGFTSSSKPSPIVLDFSLAAFTGASLEANNHGTSGSQSSNAALISSGRAPIIIGNALAGSPLNFLVSFERTLPSGVGDSFIAFLRRGSNYGYGSRTMISVDRVVMNRILNCKAGVIFMSPGRNWVGNSETTIGQQQTLYTRDVLALAAQGRIIVHMGLAMRATYVEGDANWNAVVAMDEWLQAFAASRSESFIDIATPLKLSGAPNKYTVDPAVYVDGTHYNSYGGNLLAKDGIAPAITASFGSWPDISAMLTNNNSSIFGYNRNINPYLLNTGTAGTKSGTGITAETVVPTGYTLYGTSNTVTVAGAFITKDGIPQYELTITPPGVPGAAQTIRILRTVTGGVADHFYEFGIGRVEVEESGGAASLLKVTNRCQLSVSPIVETTIMERSATDTSNYFGPYRARLRGSVIEIKTGAGSVAHDLIISVDPAGTVPFKVITSEWFSVEVAHKINFPDIAMIRQSDGNETPS